jgi:hypothetical protein
MKQVYPENRICDCDMIIPVSWIVCEFCGRIHSQMGFHGYKYYRTWKAKQIVKKMKEKMI